MFEQTFKNIDDILFKDSGADSELDYIGQTSWIMFLRYLDALELDKADEAELEGKQYTYIIEPEFHGNNEKFIYYLLQHFDLKKYATGTGVPTLNRNFVHDKIVTIPISVEVQKNIVDMLDSLIEYKNKIELNYQQKLNNLEELKKSILQKAFNGELSYKAISP